ncbi:MAG: hypothetical protein GX596_03600 [Propionibacterium sp.]|nr:hypothetical protein [Propionibacterium sp.]
MRRIRVLLALLVTAMLGLSTLAIPQAHANVQRNFIDSLVSAAQQNERDTGIPASVTIGMAALETGWGRSSMAKDPVNTLFNIKCTATQSPFQQGCTDVASYEYDSQGRRYLKVSGFRTYANTGDSLRDFGRLLTTLSRYSKAFDHQDDPDAFVREVHRGGYATDPRYTELVVGIMRSYKLYDYNVGSAAAALGDTSKLAVTTREFTDLKHGSSGQAVTTLQRLLADDGHGSLPDTGNFGWQTQDAVAHWQHDNGGFPEISGEVARDTWEALVPTLKEGDSGATVRAMQHELRHAGYTAVEASGQFDRLTRAAVEDFQRRHSLPVTGTVAKLTWGRLLGN